jgi:membrane associated rhomboid family serine protease
MQANNPQDPPHTNRPTPGGREPVFNLPSIVLLAVAICVGVHLLRLYVLTPQQDLALLVRAAFIPIRYSGQYELDIYAFTSPFTYAFLHGSFAHLIVNMIWLAAFGSPLANRLGPARFALFWAVCGLAAVALHYSVHQLDPSPVIGASGAIAGMMGAAARFGFVIDRSSGKAAFSGEPLPVKMVFRSRTVMTFLIVWMVINFVTGVVSFMPGVSDRIAWEAHVGGFVVGFFGIQFFDRRRRAAER